MDTTDHPRISKREFISRVAARSGNLIEVASEDPLRIVGEDPIRVVEVISDDRLKVVGGVYEALLAELLDVVSQGGSVVLTGFGRFYRQDHKGHKVRFGKSAVDDYSVLKFSASRSINRRLEPDDGTDPTKPESFGMIEVVDEEEGAQRPARCGIAGDPGPLVGVREMEPVA